MFAVYLRERIREDWDLRAEVERHLGNFKTLEEADLYVSLSLYKPQALSIRQTPSPNRLQWSLIGIRHETLEVRATRRDRVATFSTYESAEEYVKESRLGKPTPGKVFKGGCALSSYTAFEIEPTEPISKIEEEEVWSLPHDPFVA